MFRRMDLKDSTALLDCPEGALPWKLRRLLEDDAASETLRCRYGKNWEVLYRGLMVLLQVLHLLSCGRVCVVRKKASLVCLPLPLLKLLVSMADKSGSCPLE